MNPLDGENILIYQIINGMNRASNWRKLAFTGKHWLALARDWRQLDETGENWRKLAKTGKNWQGAGDARNAFRR
jgi:hypothetical protein